MIRRGRLPGILAAALLVAAASVALGSGPALAEPATPDLGAPNPEFYTPPVPLPAGQPGDIIRSEPMTAILDPVLHIPVEAQTTRILYRSNDLRGEPIATSGTVLQPNRPWTGPGSRPIVSLAAGSQGQGDRCAPSHAIENGSFYDFIGAGQLLARGWIVVVTDYRGLGTPPTHTYLNRVDEAYAVLDAGRAAQRLLGLGSSPVGIGGYSQGGQAAAAAAELQARYAPELNLVGAFVGAVPADLIGEGHADQLLHTDTPYLISGLIQAYPGAADRVRSLFNPRGLQLLAESRTECGYETELRAGTVPSNQVMADGRTINEHYLEEPLASLLAAQRIGDIAPATPVLLVQGDGDDTVPVEQARQLVRDWCAKGATLEYVEIPVPPIFPGTQITHALPSFPTSMLGSDYLAQRFAGVPAPSNCPGR